MTDKVLANILTKKSITTTDLIKFRTIFDVLSSLFTDENNISLWHGSYKLNDHQQIWFPNIIRNDKKQLAIKNGYGNFISDDWNYLYQFDGSKTPEQRKTLGANLHQSKFQFVTFAKINDKVRGIGYHFVGIFVFDDYQDQDPQMMVYKKVADSYQLKR